VLLCLFRLNVPENLARFSNAIDSSAVVITNLNDHVDSWDGPVWSIGISITLGGAIAREGCTASVDTVDITGIDSVDAIIVVVSAYSRDVVPSLVPIAVEAKLRLHTGSPQSVGILTRKYCVEIAVPCVRHIKLDSLVSANEETINIRLRRDRIENRNPL